MFKREYPTPTSLILPEEKDRLLEAYTPFILKTASFVQQKYVTLSDDAWSIALIAFWEAMDHFDSDKGGFEAYAAMVIKRRLIDYQRKLYKLSAEITVAPDAFTGEAGEDNAAVQPQGLLLKSAVSPDDPSLSDEVTEVSSLLAKYGFTFMDLVTCSPKSEKTKAACVAAASYMLRTPTLIAKMRHVRRLPIQAVANGTQVSFKLINRHRRYIIAVVEILDGDYPGLATYLVTVQKGVSA